MKNVFLVENPAKDLSKDKYHKFLDEISGELFSIHEKIVNLIDGNEIMPPESVSYLAFSIINSLAYMESVFKKDIPILRVIFIKACMIQMKLDGISIASDEETDEIVKSITKDIIKTMDGKGSC